MLSYTALLLLFALHQAKINRGKQTETGGDRIHHKHERGEETEEEVGVRIAHSMKSVISGTSNAGPPQSWSLDAQQSSFSISTALDEYWHQCCEQSPDPLHSSS